MTSPPIIDHLIELLSGAPDPLSLTIQQQRSATEALARGALAGLDFECTDASLGGIPGAWMEVGESRSDRAVFFIHGGAFVAGSVNSHKPVTAALARYARARVFAVDYRLAPESPFPAAIHDCEIAANAFHRLSDVDRFAVVADSAGASLALSLLMNSRQQFLPGCHALVLLCPWADLSCSGKYFGKVNEPDPILSREFLTKMAEHYLGGHDPFDPLVSPMFGNFKGLPPTLIQSGTRDLLHADALELKEKAAAAGVACTHQTWSGMVHVWHGFLASLPQAQEALSQVGDFLEDCWE